MNNKLQNPGWGQQLKTGNGQNHLVRRKKNKLKIHRKWITTYKTQDEVSNPRKLMGTPTCFAENNSLKIHRKWIKTYKTQDEVSNPRKVMGTPTWFAENNNLKIHANE